jgi:signal transduction histidine kinase
MDSGKAITEEVEAKMFQPFFTTKDIGKGTGLGLSHSSSIVLKHHGEIFLDRSQENSCFVVEIPISQPRG